MKKVKAMGNVYFVVFSFDPSQLIHHFVAPFVHALVAYVHLGVEDPQEAEAFGGEVFNWDVYDLLVAHC